MYNFCYILDIFVRHIGKNFTVRSKYDYVDLFSANEVKKR